VAYNDWVDWRLAHGSQCSICPLAGQRKVGTAGPIDSDVVLIGEAPGADDETYNLGHQKYGSPFQGRSGWALKVKLLAPAGLVETEMVEGANGELWPKIKRLKCFILNTVMCRPPDNKITSPEGKIAVACCSPSARALLTHLETLNTKRSYVPLGATALNLLLGRDDLSVGTYRGRVLSFDSASLMRVPESQLKKLWATVESLATPYVSLIKAFLTKQRAMLKPENQLKLVAQREKERVKALKTLEKETLALAKPHLKVMEICLSHTRKVLKLGK
jgi:uracil-DNA glycosylase family 4